MFTCLLNLGLVSHASQMSMSAQVVINGSSVARQAIIWLEITTQLASKISHQFSCVLCYVSMYIVQKALVDTIRLCAVWKPATLYFTTFTIHLYMIAYNVEKLGRLLS